MWNQAREPASPFSAGHQLAREYLGKHAGEAAHASSMAGIPILSSNWGVMREDLPLFHAWSMTPLHRTCQPGEAVPTLPTLTEPRNAWLEKLCPFSKTGFLGTRYGMGNKTMEAMPRICGWPVPLYMTAHHGACLVLWSQAGEVALPFFRAVLCREDKMGSLAW